MIQMPRLGSTFFTVANTGLALHYLLAVEVSSSHSAANYKPKGPMAIAKPSAGSQDGFLISYASQLRDLRLAYFEP